MVGGDYRWTDKSVSSLGFVFELIPQNSFDTGKIEYSSEDDLLGNTILDYHRKYDDDLYKYQMNLYHKSASIPTIQIPLSVRRIKPNIFTLLSIDKKK